MLSRPKYVSALKGICRGVEKESLRVTHDSRIAATSHPVSFGSPLTHDWITTDYAEVQMEFITPAGTDAEKTLAILADIHRHVYHHLDEELLWPASMPCTIESEEDIELANYGDSNAGKIKTVYRQGLKNRYGSMMQVIAGVHFNFSMPDSFWPVWQQIKNDRQPLQDFISESYFGLIRNFLRLGWLVPYLFGASPAVDNSFLRSTRSTLPLQPIGRESHYLPMSTSLRMSDLGYNSKEQGNWSINYNSLPKFVKGLRQAVTTPNPVFEKIGVRQNGEYRQLNSNILQMEGELYGAIRPKQVTRAGENLSCALAARGVQYVEVRSLDINPYCATGVDLEQVYFLDIFLTYCLLQDSPELNLKQQAAAQRNLNKVATDGRKVSLELMDGETPRSLKSWGEDVFSDLTKVALTLDTVGQSEKYRAALDSQYQKLLNPALTLSARIVADMAEQDLDFNELAVRLARQHRQTLLGTEYQQLQEEEFAAEAASSLKRQKELEETQTLGFDDFLRLSLQGTLAGSVLSGEHSCQRPSMPDEQCDHCEQ
ncbi:glutamate--cysteine ligase [Desulfopila sp. IMCC35008]|uniref:glutamate--cysteine ligase n=1 Tax=Desulfopila sp. IMCC35008 TaxID=2653858 RepID=UPI0013D38E79